MFEVGFTEIVLIVGLALLVLGPEKLAALVRKVGRWTGRARAMARQLQTQLEQEVTLDEFIKSRPTQPNPGQQPEATPAEDDTAAEHRTGPQDPSAQTHPEEGHSEDVHPEVHPEEAHSEAVHPEDVHPAEAHPAQVHAEHAHPAEVHPDVSTSTHPDTHDHDTERSAQATAASEAAGADSATTKSTQ